MRALSATTKVLVSQLAASPKFSHSPETAAKEAMKSVPDLLAPALRQMQNQLLASLRAQQIETTKELTAKMSSAFQEIEGIRNMVGRMQGGAGYANGAR